MKRLFMEIKRLEEEVGRMITLGILDEMEEEEGNGVNTGIRLPMTLISPRSQLDSQIRRTEVEFQMKGIGSLRIPQP